MLKNRSTIALPIIMIALGSGALLTSLGVAPKIDWIWTLGLALAGLVTLIVAGLDRVTFVICCMCFATCVTSIMRQIGSLRMDVEIPILIIACGLFMLMARHPKLRNPKWLE